MLNKFPIASFDTKTNQIHVDNLCIPFSYDAEAFCPKDKTFKIIPKTKFYMKYGGAVRACKIIKLYYRQSDIEYLGIKVAGLAYDELVFRVGCLEFKERVFMDKECTMKWKMVEYATDKNIRDFIGMCCSVIPCPNTCTDMSVRLMRYGWDAVNLKPIPYFVYINGLCYDYATNSFSLDYAITRDKYQASYGLKLEDLSKAPYISTESAIADNAMPVIEFEDENTEVPTKSFTFKVEMTITADSLEEAKKKLITMI